MTNRNRPRFLTVTAAAAELGVSSRTVWRALSRTADADPNPIPRERYLLPAGTDDRMMQQQVVEVEALRVYLDGIRPGRPRNT